MGAVSSQSEAAVGEFFPRRCFGVSFSAPGCQPIRERHSGVRQEIWTPLLGLPRKLADAEFLRPEIQRQRLPAHERPGCSDLAESRLLAGYLPHDSDLASRQH